MYAFQATLTGFYSQQSRPAEERGRQVWAEPHATVKASRHMRERLAGAVCTAAQQADPGWAALAQSQAGCTPLQDDRAALHRDKEESFDRSSRLGLVRLPSASQHSK